MTVAEDRADRARANRRILVDEVTALPAGTAFRVKLQETSTTWVRAGDGVLPFGEDGPSVAIERAVPFGALDIELLA